VKTAISGGTPRQQAAVREAANEWTKHANLRFDFVPSAEREHADIRVTLSDDAESWSYLGTAALGIADSEPTMTIGTAGGATPEVVRATALREFGRLINEHQNPNARIRWNRDAILKEMKDQGWDEATVDSQFFQRDPLRDYRPFDPSSIMMYNFPASWTLDGKGFSAGTALSASDKKFVAELYPRAKAEVRAVSAVHAPRPRKVKKAKKKSAKRK
jgi:hypothetical protein